MTPSRKEIVIGSRASKLALYQAEWVRSHLSAAHPGVGFTVKEISTSGDIILDKPLSELGGKGVFTKEIEDALLDRSIDLAVHSLKDVPTELPPGLALAAVTKREDVRDVFIPHPAAGPGTAGGPARTIDELPEGSVIATGSLRRRSQILSWKKGFRVVDLRGNLTTRFAKLEKSSWAGMILARAGIVRLGFADRIGETIDTGRMMPAVGQGALGIEIREGDEEVGPLLSVLTSEAATLSTSAERAFLGRLEGGCKVPIGAHGRIEANRLVLDGLVASLDGTRVYRGKVNGDPADARDLGVRLAESLLKSGAGTALAEIRPGGAA